MKKALLTLSLLGLAGAAAFGASSLISGKTALEVKADGEPVTYIPMAANAFTSESEANRMGDFSATNRTYWSGWSFEALDTFFCGESKGDEKGTITLNSWTQTTQYIYFQWGAAGQEDVYLHFVCTSTTLNTDGKLISEEGGEPYVYTADHRNDTQVDNKLLLRYFEIPTVEYNKLGGVNGFSMTIEFHDQHVGEGYGFHSFGYLHVNQTRAQVGDAMRYYLNHLNQNLADYEVGARKSIQGHYFTNAYLKNVFYAVESDISDGFDSQDSFINHWYFDHTYYNNDGAGRDFDRAISDRPAHANGAPYNKEGAGFFRGYHESDNNTGFQATDCSKYRFISRPFVVDEDNPFISIKMGGKASLHVIDATVNPGVNQAADLGWIDNTFYSLDGTDPLVYTGWLATTMVRHVINLQAYANRTIQLAIADISDETTWKAANFDELHVNFTPTSFGVDALTQVNNDQTYYCALPDKYVGSEHDGSCAYGIKYRNSENAVADTTDVRKAAYFLEDYYLLARDFDNGTNVCTNNVYKSEDMKTLLGNSGYNGLTDGAKHIVCASTDFQHIGESGDWFRNPISTFTVGSSLEYLLSVNNISGVTYSNLSAGKLMTSASWTISIILLVAGIAFVGLFLFFRKKHQKE